MAEETEDLYNIDELLDEATANTNTTTATSSVPLFTDHVFHIGDHVIVLGGDRLYAAVVTTFLPDTTLIQVKYYEFDAEVALPKTSLQPIASMIPASGLLPNEITLGSTVESKYAADQQYYPAKVTGITQYGYTVTYPDYGTSEEVPIEYLRPVMSISKSSDTKSSSNNAVNGEKKSGIIPIPENLKILPTDTEEEIQRKKKKIKQIKNRNRLIQQEEEVQHVQQSWKKFVEKGTKRSMSGISKQSMFASSEDVTAKVGVVNSGKGMTTFQERKKHKFET